MNTAADNIAAIKAWIESDDGKAWIESDDGSESYFNVNRDAPLNKRTIKKRSLLERLKRAFRAAHNEWRLA